ncbi:hypothetical protein OFN55_43215, partial [Escherichia coli]|nr:hypothetical protein [Escherichia coli]
RTRVTVNVDLAESGVADKYTQLDSEQTVIVSTLSAPQFSNLEESEFSNRDTLVEHLAYAISPFSDQMYIGDDYEENPV